MLEFLLHHNPKEGTYSMNGGPLTRTWTEKEWEAWLKAQRPRSTHEWYRNWAKEARDNPYTDISRQLG